MQFISPELDNYSINEFIDFFPKIVESAGNTIIAPSMLTKNMNVSSIPMSTWNLRAENTQVLTPIANVIPVNNTALPRSFNAAR